MSISTSARKLPPAYSDGLLLKINIPRIKRLGTWITVQAISVPSIETEIKEIE